MSQAGQSARREYERRREADLQRRRHHFRWKLALVVLSPIFVFLVIRAVLSTLIGGGIAGLVAAVVAFCSATTLASELWGRKPSTEAWRKGAEGEEMTARTLAKLPAGYVALHDLRIPGSRANIDHLVIGPSGVFTVETKHFTSDVDVSWGKATRNGRSMAPVVDQAAGQAKLVKGILGLEVRPVVCVQGAGVNSGLVSRGKAGRVQFCSDRRLNGLITSSKGTLSAGEISRLVELAGRSF